jgi:hypothetical protein
MTRARVVSGIGYLALAIALATLVTATGTAAHVVTPLAAETTAGDAAGEQEVVYHGNRQSHIFHQPSCRYYSCANCTVVFKSREEAVKAGYRPCGVCKP